MARRDVVLPSLHNRGQVEPITQVRREGIATIGREIWTWGPVPVHEQCRTDLTTPYDTSVGQLTDARWEYVDVATATREQRLQESCIRT